MANPVGIFVGLPAAQLQQIQANALARIDGTITSVAETGGSYGKTAGMPPQDVLREVTYAMQAASGTLPPTQTRHDFGGVADAYGSGYHF